MAIADRIGYDSTGRRDKNELYREEAVEQEDGYVKSIDPTDNNTVIGQWNTYKETGNTSKSELRVFVKSSSSLNRSMTVEPLLEEFEEAANKMAELKTVKLRDIIYDISSGETPTAKGDAYICKDDGEKGVPFLRIQNISDNELKLENVYYINSATHYGKLKRSILRDGDVLVTITGRVGTACVVPKGLRGNINQHIVRFSVIRDFCPEYIALFLNTKLGRLLSQRFATGGTRIALDYGALLDLDIPALEYDKQVQVIKTYMANKEEITRLESRIMEIEQSTSCLIEEQILKS